MSQKKIHAMRKVWVLLWTHTTPKAQAWAQAEFGHLWSMGFGLMQGQARPSLLFFNIECEFVFGPSIPYFGPLSHLNMNMNILFFLSNYLQPTLCPIQLLPKKLVIPIFLQVSFNFFYLLNLGVAFPFHFLLLFATILEFFTLITSKVILIFWYHERLVKPSMALLQVVTRFCLPFSYCRLFRQK